MLGSISKLLFHAGCRGYGTAIAGGPGLLANMVADLGCPG